MTRTRNPEHIAGRKVPGWGARRIAQIPPCAASMGCLCAGHARGNAATAPCDTSEIAPTASTRATRPPTMTDFEAWMRDIYAKSRKIDPDEERDWNAMALGFMVARGVDYRVAVDWELCSAFTCGDRPRAEAATAMSERVWLAHDWADRVGYRAAYRTALVAAADATEPPAGIDVALWVRSLDDAAWEAARVAVPVELPKKRNARSAAARAHLDAVAAAGHTARLAASSHAFNQRLIAGWNVAGTPLPECAAADLCDPHRRGYPTTTPCADLRMFDPNAPKGA